MRAHRTLSRTKNVFCFIGVPSTPKRCHFNFIENPPPPPPARAALWSEKPRRAPSRHFKDVRVYGIKTTNYNEHTFPPPACASAPPPPFPVPAVCAYHRKQEDNAAGVSSSSLPTDVGPSAAKVSGIAIDRDEEKAGSDGNEGGVETTAAAVAAQGILGKKKPYCVRAHVFQCKGLPSSEASGLLDPYIKVSAALLR